MNNLKKSIMSVAMAAITAASPILSSYVAYAMAEQLQPKNINTITIPDKK